jgi:hypothetical protein
MSFYLVPCSGYFRTGELHIDSENINGQFELEKQTVITECPAIDGLGFKPPGTP